jgi:hypothetical protein
MMRSFLRPRWRKPALTVIAGTVLGAACAIGGSQHWWLWLSLVAIGTAVRAFTFWVAGGEEGDLGALAGSRGDERQRQISLRSRALACNFAAVGAFAGMTVGVALRASWWWSFAAVLCVLGFGFLFGLSSYGVAEEGPADDQGTYPQSPARAGR